MGVVSTEKSDAIFIRTSYSRKRAQRATRLVRKGTSYLRKPAQRATRHRSSLRSSLKSFHLRTYYHTP